MLREQMKIQDQALKLPSFDVGVVTMRTWFSGCNVVLRIVLCSNQMQDWRKYKMPIRLPLSEQIKKDIYKKYSWLK